MASSELPLDKLTLVSIEEIVASSGFSLEEVRELIEFGVFEPHAAESSNDVFFAHAIDIARVARRLQLDFELPLAGVALALAYRERIEELEAKLHSLECLLPGHLTD